MLWICSPERAKAAPIAPGMAFHAGYHPPPIYLLKCLPVSVAWYIPKNENVITDWYCSFSIFLKPADTIRSRRGQNCEFDSGETLQAASESMSSSTLAAKSPSGDETKSLSNFSCIIRDTQACANSRLLIIHHLSYNGAAIYRQVIRISVGRIRFMTLRTGRKIYQVVNENGRGGGLPGIQIIRHWIKGLCIQVPEND